MSFLYRHKENGQLYKIEHLIHDMGFMNNNGFSGIYANPYNWHGAVIKYLKQDFEPYTGNFDPLKFVEDNFDKVAELHEL